MFNISETAKKMILIIGLIFVTSLFIGVFYFKNMSEITAFAKGLSLGSMVSAIKVVMLEKTIDKTLDFDEKYARNYATLLFLLRLLITSAILIFVGISNNINIWGTIIGLFSLQISAYIIGFFENRFLSKQ